MRLLRTATYEHVEFTPDKLPPYAILSHTWGDDEVVYADMAREQRNRNSQVKSSFAKIRYSCGQAVTDGLEFIWIDTVCIDKSSSAELSEAINSMFEWYAGAAKCYAYISDCTADVDMTVMNSQFTQSRWFTRGWTLQELIAPENVIFFSDNWKRLGERRTLAHLIAVRTGIDEAILVGEKTVESASIAKRMSWASKRETTRPEDLAYSLMGIFSVNMPMLYGEGKRAFLRLQEEIMRNSDDQSIFAWVDPSQAPDSLHGLLAKSPSAFLHANTIMPYQDREFREPFSISNRGLRIDLHLTPVTDPTIGSGDIYVAAIDCPAPPDFQDSSFLALYLRKLSTGNKQYARIKVGTFGKVLSRGTLQTVYVRQTPLIADLDSIYPHHVFQLRDGPAKDEGYKVTRIERGSTTSAPRPLASSRSPMSWIGQPVHASDGQYYITPVSDTSCYTFTIAKGANHLAGAISLERDDGERLIIMLGSLGGFDVGFDAIDHDYHFVTSTAKDHIASLERQFRPRKMGEYIDLEKHRVRVTAARKVESFTKYYMVDIEVTGFHRSLNPVLMIQDMLDTDSIPERTRKPGTSTFKRLFGKDRD